MLEFISNNTWIVWLALVVICGIIGGFIKAYDDKKYWEITVDGEAFECVCCLDIDRWHHEVEFWDEMQGCWRHLIYSRLEFYPLRKINEDQ